jgi:hypothetical protein
MVCTERLLGVKSISPCCKARLRAPMSRFQLVLWEAAKREGRQVSAEDAVLYKTCHEGGKGGGLRDKEGKLPQLLLRTKIVRRISSLFL